MTYISLSQHIKPAARRDFRGGCGALLSSSRVHCKWEGRGSTRPLYLSTWMEKYRWMWRRWDGWMKDWWCRPRAGVNKWKWGGGAAVPCFIWDLIPHGVSWELLPGLWWQPFPSPTFRVPNAVPCRRLALGHHQPIWMGAKQLATIWLIVMVLIDKFKQRIWLGAHVKLGGLASHEAASITPFLSSRKVGRALPRKKIESAQTSRCDCEPFSFSLFLMGNLDSQDPIEIIGRLEQQETMIGFSASTHTLGFRNINQAYSHPRRTSELCVKVSQQSVIGVTSTEGWCIHRDPSLVKLTQNLSNPCATWKGNQWIIFCRST